MNRPGTGSHADGNCRYLPSRSTYGPSSMSFSARSQTALADAEPSLSRVERHEVAVVDVEMVRALLAKVLGNSSGGSPEQRIRVVGS